MRGLTIAVISVVTLSPLARAARVQVGLSAAFVGDVNTLASGASAESSYYDVFAYFKPYGKWNLYLGLEYLASSYTGPNNAGVNSALVTDTAAAGLRYVFGRNDVFYFGVAYGIATNATYQTSGATAEAWTGASMISQAGLRPELSKNLRVKAAIHYVNMSSSSKTPASATNPSSSVNSFVRTNYFPTLGIEYGF